MASRDQWPDLAQEVQKPVHIRVVVDRAEEDDRAAIGRRVGGAWLEVLHVRRVGDHRRSHRRHKRAGARLVLLRAESHAVEAAPEIHLFPLDLRPVGRVVDPARDSRLVARLLPREIELDVVLVEDQPGPLPAPRNARQQLVREEGKLHGDHVERAARKERIEHPPQPRQIVQAPFEAPARHE